jgi:thiol-disulfide isomerase/thioredoxin
LLIPSGNRSLTATDSPTFRATATSSLYNRNVLELRHFLPVRIPLMVWLIASASAFAFPQDQAAPPQAPARSAKPNAQQKDLTEQLALQKAIDDAGNDRAALVRNLEAFLKTYPESQQRPQIYRAIVESSMKVDDFPRATDYAERLVALRPEDASINILAIQLLDRYGDAPGWRRGISYCTRVLEQLDHASSADKSPRMSTESWENDKKRDRSSVLLIRGRLYEKLNDLSNAQKDFQSSYALVPSAAAAIKLGDLAERRKDQNAAVQEYARAFALAGDSSGANGRSELRKKIGNVWRLAHGSEDGLGEYLLHSFDEVSASTAPSKAIRNAGLKNPYDFVLRKAPGGASFPMTEIKGKVVVLNFWATWCGPCRAMEPHFEKVSAHFAANKEIQFYSVNCDDDETLVPAFLEEEKPKTSILFADNLDNLFAVSSFPTTLILDRTGKIAFRSDGFDPDTIDKDLTEAIERTLHPNEAANAQ